MLDPLTVAEVGDLLGLGPADAIDAALVVGGFPLVAQSWPAGQDLRQFLDDALADQTSSLIVTGERDLAAEFPDPVARAALVAIGSGESGFTAVANRAPLPPTSLRRVLDMVLSKRIVVAERPLSTRPAPKQVRLRIADPYLRFWLRFVEPGLDEIERGRGDLAAERIDEGWAAYRGVAVEPIVRASIDRLLPDSRLDDTRRIGAFRPYPVL